MRNTIMKVNVTHVGSPWKATPSSDPLYTIHLEGVGAPVKTYDAELATLGEHEAETFNSKSGKEYYRIPKAAGSFAPKQREFKADPQKMKQDLTLEVARNQSIQRQVSVKAVVELICSGQRKYDQLVDTYNDLMRLLNPEQVLEETFEVEDNGDFAKFLAEDQPPITNYEGE